MAEYKTTVALEIGAQSVVMAVFTPSGRRFALSRYARKDILLDPVEEGMRIDYVSQALADLVKQLKVKGKDVRNVVSGQKVFMRFIKLVALDTVEDLQEQVGYEVRQHIPFPPEDIIYSYQKLGEAVDGEQEVLLVAIKKDELDDLNSQVEANGLRTKSVDCSTTSLYNAFCANYPDETEPVMLLDIGAKTTDILFIEEGRFFTRSVTAAGSFITSSISREFNVSFREAEQMKIEQGLISLGNGHTEGMDEATANLATVIRNAANRLSSEVQRTINHYRGQYKGNPPAKAYICGGGARLPFMAEFLQSTLDIPVEFFDPLQALVVGNKVDEETLQLDSLCLGPVVGAAVSGAKAGVFDIDLVPTSVGKDRAEKRLIPIALISGAIALAGAGFFYHTASTRAAASERVLQRIEEPMARLDRLNSAISNCESVYKKDSAELKRLAELYRRRNAYADILIQLSKEMADTGYWITDFEPMINYNVNNTEVQDPQKATREVTTLIDINKSHREAGSSINSAPEESKDALNRNQTPMVTAVRLRGYIFKRSIEGTSQMLLNRILDTKFSEKNPHSLFSLKSEDVIKDMNHYFKVVDTNESKNLVPPYVDKFYMVMPLKEPLSIPELESGKK